MASKKYYLASGGPREAESTLDRGKSEVREVSEANWLVLVGHNTEANPVVIDNLSYINYQKCMSAINAFSDTVMLGNLYYDMTNSEEGLHLRAGKSLFADFADRVGMIHQNYSGELMRAPDPDVCFNGWGVISVSNYLPVVESPQDLRNNDQLERNAELRAAGKRDRFIDTRFKMQWKHDFIDAVIRGQTLIVWIAWNRNYITKRLKQWKMKKFTDRLEFRSNRITDRAIRDEVMSPAYLKDRENEKNGVTGGDVIKDVDKETGEVTLAPLAIKVLGSTDVVDLHTVPKGAYLIATRRGRIMGLPPVGWDPQTMENIEQWQAAVNSKFQIVLD